MVENWLPERTRVWIERRWETPMSIDVNAITYNANWGGMRITRQATGFAVHERGEKSRDFDSFVIWASDMDGLQKHLAWAHASDWEDHTNGVHDLPNARRLAPGFELDEDAQRKQYLSHKGQPVARLHRGATGEAGTTHSQLLLIPLDDLEHAIQDPSGLNVSGDPILDIRPYATPSQTPTPAAAPSLAPTLPQRRSFWPWRRRGRR